MRLTSDSCIPCLIILVAAVWRIACGVQSTTPALLHSEAQPRLILVIPNTGPSMSCGELFQSVSSSLKSLSVIGTVRSCSVFVFEATTRILRSVKFTSRQMSLNISPERIPVSIPQMIIGLRCFRDCFLVSPFFTLSYDSQASKSLDSSSGMITRVRLTSEALEMNPPSSNGLKGIHLLRRAIFNTFLSKDSSLWTDAIDRLFGADLPLWSICLRLVGVCSLSSLYAEISSEVISLIRRVPKYLRMTFSFWRASCQDFMPETLRPSTKVGAFA